MYWQYPIKTRVAQVVAEAMVCKVMCILGPPKILTIDKDSAFTEDVIQFILIVINIHFIFIGLN